jgi:hypothetical protein
MTREVNEGEGELREVVKTPFAGSCLRSDAPAHLAAEAGGSEAGGAAAGVAVGELAPAHALILAEVHACARRAANHAGVRGSGGSEQRRARAAAGASSGGSEQRNPQWMCVC